MNAPAVAMLPLWFRSEASVLESWFNWELMVD